MYWMNVSLDLRIEAKPGENGGGDWMRIDERLHREFNRRAAKQVLSVEGRVIYDIMEQSWPDMRGDATLPEVLREYAEIWVSTPKILVSRTRTSAEHNTRILGGVDAIDRLAAIRRDTDGDIGVGGANIATQLLNRGLLDEVLLFTHPAYLGQGRPLFDQVDGPIEFELLEQQSYDRGVTLHRYTVKR